MFAAVASSRPPNPWSMQLAAVASLLVGSTSSGPASDAVASLAGVRVRPKLRPSPSRGIGDLRQRPPSSYIATNQ